VLVEFLKIAKNLLQERCGLAELPQVFFRKQFKSIRQSFYAAFAAFRKNFFSFRSCGKTDSSSVFSCVAFYEAGALKSSDDAAHRGRANLFGIGKLAEGFRAAKDKDGKRGKLGGANAAFKVADPQATEEMNGGGVEAIGDCIGFGAKGDLGLDRLHGF
jgi:hypothetical protein